MSLIRSGLKEIASARFCVGLSFLLGLPAVTAAQIPCRYDVQIISAGPCSIFGPQPTSGTGINSNGDICGWHCACVCAKYDRAFLWTPEGGFLTLTQPPGILGSDAFAINDHRQIAGTFEVNGQGHSAFLWQDGQWQNLPIPPPGTNSEAFSINNTGEVAGYWANFAIGPNHACIWRNGTLVDLNPSFGTPNSIAYDINDRGQVTGWMGDADFSDARAFIWNGGEVVSLGPITRGVNSQGRSINDHGEVCGFGWTANPLKGLAVRRGFAWIGGQMADLGVLPGYSDCFALGISNDRQVVGYCFALGLFSHGFVWQNGLMGDLNDLIDPEAGLIIMIANSINDAGQITGQARLPSHDIVAVLLTPVQASIADLDSDCVVDQKDLSLLLQSWSIPPTSPGCKGTPPCKADLNRDGLVNSLDLGILLVNWSVIS